MKVGKKTAAAKYKADYTTFIERCSVSKTEVATILQVRHSDLYSLLKRIRERHTGKDILTVNILNKTSLTIGHFRSRVITSKGALRLLLSKLLEVSANDYKIMRLKRDSAPLVYLEIYPGDGKS